MKEIKLLMFIHETDFIDMPSIFEGKVNDSTHNQLRREVYEYTDEYEKDIQRWIYFILNLRADLQEILFDHVNGKNSTDEKCDIYRKSNPLIKRVSAKRVNTLLKILGGDPNGYLILQSD